jgi:DNA helicase-4
MEARNKTESLINDLIDTWRDFYKKPDYYLTIHIPEIIANPQKRTMREDLLISCINDAQNIVPLIKDVYQQKISAKANSEITILLSSYNFLMADHIYEANKEYLPGYIEQRNVAMQRFVAENVQHIETQLEKFNFSEADRFYQGIKDYFPFEDYSSSVAYYKEKQSVEKTVREIDEKLQLGLYDEATVLFSQISHFYDDAFFEQKVLASKVRFELSRHAFLEADRLYSKCSSNTLNNYLQLKAAAIQDYFKKSETKVTQEQAIALADQSEALLIKARAGSGKTRVLASKTVLLVDRYKVNPDKILVLAFNKKAAREIGSRIQKVYGIEGFENARTFHSLAFQLVKFNGDILFDNQGEFSRPALTNFVQDILRSIWSPQIQTNLYLLFRKEMHSLEQSGGLLSNADYLAFIRNKRDITLNGDRVKSTGEKFIADYLFEHDIPFFYERVEV